MNEPRIHVDQDLRADQATTLGKDVRHYAGNVLRLGAGDFLRLFNGRDGEWRAEIIGMERSALTVQPVEQTRLQRTEPDLWLLFAPIKGKRIDAIAEKAGELGAAEIRPVITRRTVVSRVNTERLQANAREAAEQCERLSLPTVQEPEALEKVLANWPAGRRLLFADERGGARPIGEALIAAATEPATPWAVLIGPEGGFEDAEKDLIRALPDALPVSLGPRLLRADTAAFATLALWQAHLGDWQTGDI